MTSEKSIDFDCEFFQQKRAEEGALAADRRTTESIIYHLCTHPSAGPKSRCNLKTCPKKTQES